MKDDESDGNNRDNPQHLPLKAEFKYDDVDPEREVAGSVQYINEQLLPKSKRVEIMLWSGSCRPHPEAIRLAEKLGIEHMNGGSTIISKRWPGRAGIAPRTTMMGDSVQVYAPNQNEMQYTGDWRAPFLGGYAAVIETFQLTETPRRLKPVNVYYHFYSAGRRDSFNALTHVYDWAMAQPLHAITAAEYARLVRDCRRAEITALDARRWHVSHHGDCQTLRMKTSAGYPVLDEANGVVGWNDEGEWRYVHTMGREVELLLTDKKQIKPSVVSCTVPVSSLKITPNGIKVETQGLRPGTLALRLPGSQDSWRAWMNAEPITLPVMNDDVAEIALPAKARVEVERIRALSLQTGKP